MSALTSSPSSAHRETGERAGRRVARRERGGVVVDRDRFLVAGHHHHVVVRLAPHRALRPQPVEVRVRVGDELVAAEEVDRVVVGHSTGSRRLRQDYAGDCTGRSNRIRPWTSRSRSRNATWSALCREFAQKEIARACPAGVGRGALPDRPAARDGRAGPARHADPRGVGRHRHVDGRLRRRDGADSASPTSRSRPRGRRT